MVRTEESASEGVVLLPAWRVLFVLGFSAAVGWGVVAGNVVRQGSTALDQPLHEIFAVTNGSALNGAVLGASLFLAGSLNVLLSRSNMKAKNRSRHPIQDEPEDAGQPI